MRAKCYKKIIDNYESLVELWQTSLENGKLDTDVKSRIIGCLSHMKKFNFCYGVNIAYKFYSLTDNLSKSLQSKKMSAISGQNLARLTIAAIESMRNDRDADNFFKYVKKEQAAFYPSIEESRLGRKRNNPTYSRIGYLDGYESSAEMYCYDDPSEHYRQVYFEVIDVFVTGITVLRS